MHVNAVPVSFWQLVAQGPRAPGGPNRPWERSFKPLALFMRRAHAKQSGLMGLSVDFVDVAGADRARLDWQDLCARALEPNIFMEPGFALAAALLHPEAQRPCFALLWDRSEHDATARDLVGVWPIAGQGARSASGTVRGWQSVQAVLGTPLIDAARAPAVVDAFLATLAETHGPSSLLLVPHLLQAGPTYALLQARANATGRACDDLSAHRRAVLWAGHDPTGPGALSGKRRSKLARQRRRLAERGAVSFQSSTAAEEIRVAVERFLVLEGSGWKGARATALLSDIGAATFARVITRLLARTGQCRIDTLALDGQPIAMAVVLQSGNRAYIWKIAFDEAFASYSPGVLLTLDITARQLADSTVAFTDSCAVAGHPMIETYWPDRMGVTDLAIAVVPGESRDTAGTLRREQLRRGFREWAKGFGRDTLACVRQRQLKGAADTASAPVRGA